MPDQFLYILLFVAGFVVLIKGAQWLVDGASSLARCLGVSDMLIGLTVVALGTSMPELFIDTTAAVRGNTGLVIGSLVGANIANILLILGMSAVIYPLAINHNTSWKEIPYVLLAALVVFVMGNDGFFNGGGGSFIGRSDGLVFIAFLIIFLYYLASIAGEESRERVALCARKNIRASLLQVAGGLVGLFFGSRFVVSAALYFAARLDVSENVVGLTIVSFGSTLPEMTASVVAALKKRSDLALGNIIGSNIVNIFLIMGISAIIRPLPLRPEDNFAIGVAITASILLFLSAFVGKRSVIDRWIGVVFFFLYLFYIVMAIRVG
ncbi:MAG: calcium/sodium antiporter [Candidatus Omnitrophica bacterium]|nr:calcium/sodium antiporter [Candidatus Omnitrophota bacterium]